MDVSPHHRRRCVFVSHQRCDDDDIEQFHSICRLFFLISLLLLLVLLMFLEDLIEFCKIQADEAARSMEKAHSIDVLGTKYKHAIKWSTINIDTRPLFEHWKRFHIDYHHHCCQHDAWTRPYAPRASFCGYIRYSRNRMHGKIEMEHYYYHKRTQLMIIILLIIVIDITLSDSLRYRFRFIELIHVPVALIWTFAQIHLFSIFPLRAHTKYEINIYVETPNTVINDVRIISGQNKVGAKSKIKYTCY